MEKEFVALVFIAILAGLGGGYGLGFTIYQPQISTLRTDYNELQTRYDELQMNCSNLQVQMKSVEKSLNKTWHFVTNFTLSADEWGSSVFSIQGELWRINWSEPPPPSFMTVSGWVGFLVCTPGGPTGPYVIDSVDIGPALTGPFLQARGTCYMYGMPGSYYIILRGIQNGWISFTIESYH